MHNEHALVSQLSLPSNLSSVREMGQQQHKQHPQELSSAGEGAWSKTRSICILLDLSQAHPCLWM